MYEVLKAVCHLVAIKFVLKPPQNPYQLFLVGVW